VVTDEQREATKSAIELLTAHLESLDTGEEFRLATFERLVREAENRTTDLLGGLLNLSTILLFHAASLGQRTPEEVLRSLAPRIDLT
jgi:hypothetical protein